MSNKESQGEFVSEIEHLWERLLEHLQAGVYLVDRSQRILFWNQGAKEITGHLRRDVLGRHVQEVIQMDDKDQPNVESPENSQNVGQVPDFERQKNHIDMAVTNEGLRIERTESASGTFFNRGSAKFNADRQDLLFALAAELGKLQNKIYVEGYTDAKPYSAGAS